MKKLNFIYVKPKFEPTKELLIVPALFLGVVGALSAATFLATSANGGLYFILYAIVGAALLGVIAPAFWELVKNKGTVENLGITKKNLGITIALQLLLSFLLYYKQLPLLLEGVVWEKFIPLVALALTIGFFEAVFWRGWMIQKLEKSLGTIAAVILGSGLYSVYHIGYGMKWDEMFFLFFIGLMFATVYALTRNIFVLWPLFQPIGQLLTITKDGGLNLPFIATVGFLEVFVVMLLAIFFINKNKDKLRKKLLKS